MPAALRALSYDVVVIGSGSAGLAASIAAARNGARTLLVDAGPSIGGELLSGLPLNACLSACGEWVVGGIVRELLDRCETMGGLVAPYFDWRSLWLVCVDPEVMKLACAMMVSEAGVELLLNSFAEDVVVDDGRVTGVVIANKSGKTLVTAEVFIDCSGDGDVAVRAGAQSQKGGEGGAFQPVTMMFRMQGVDPGPLLDFVVAHPEFVGLGESPAIAHLSKAECAERLRQQNVPSVFFDGQKPFIAQAIAAGELAPCGILAVCPVSTARREVSLNTTRIADLDATDPDALSRALPRLVDQVWTCVRFLQNRVPGFEKAVFSGLAPRIGIRETRRIMGLEVLTGDDVLTGRKRGDGIAKGAHELDVHGAGRQHRREMIRDGGSYDIPFGCLVPRGLRNLLVAGRCLSATREAHGSARVMGTCMSMGQAAGTAAALCATSETPIAQLSVQALRERLREQGAVLETTY
ncbi:FAD-dependent oxidoreductase [uncultured Alsobacter sp.]|uniref:FAD-dependent oxidoreductase n=1 Tax=uncultured Alsobacter sp. TaxID=1748258 RepID=UPI0025F0D93D|nr:FAD-dependent oxidoreductase [uncultured Alsobacter sp.]